MRRAVLAPSGALVLVACNALTGAGDLGVCEGAECTDRGNGTDGGSSGALDSGSDAIVTVPDGGTLPTTCSDGQKACEGKTAAICVGSTWSKTPCAELCEAGACLAYLSCRNAAGSTCATNKSCCETKAVPGGPFNRQNSAQYPATVSAFSLDVYEVTVGRFRAFVDAGKGTQAFAPAAGSGAHPKIGGSGWQASWNKYLFSSSTELKNSLNGGTWTTTAGANETKPITNVRWLTAFAFCAWDGGRLPTYAEWTFASEGGNDQRVYPWSMPSASTTITSTNAAYSCALDGTPYQCPATVCSVGGASPCDAIACAGVGGTCTQPACFGCDIAKDIAKVGQLTAGIGKFGHFDLGGNASEILLDATGAKQPEDSIPTTCADCAVLMGPDPANSGFGGAKEFRFYKMGGGWRDGTTELRNTNFDDMRWNDTDDQLGFRCARD